MNNKQKLIILITGLFLVLIFGGLSYAFFSTVTNNESSSTILAKGGKMTIKYANGSGTIKMQNIYPREEAWVNKVFTVTGNNTTDLEMNYRLYLVVSNNAFNFGDLTYSISGTTTNSTDTLISKANQSIPKLGQVIMGIGIFKSKTSTHSYNLRIFYKETGENQNNGQSKNFAGYIKIDSGSSLAYDALMEGDKNLNSNSSAFNGPIARTEIEEVTFNNTNVVPSNAIASWDASDKQNGSIMAYTLDEDNDGLYELYIGQNGGVVANPNSQYLFGNFFKLKIINLTNFDTSKVTDMSRMFYSSGATSLDLSSFDTSKVTNMYQMFSGSSATSLDLSSFDTSNVTSMYGMFYLSKATKIKGLDKFDNSKVISMSYMFAGTETTSLDLSNFDTSGVTTMSHMFWSSKATSLDLSGFDTSKVTDMSMMFASSDATEIRGLTQFNTSKVTNMSSMFTGSKATTLDLSSFDTSNVTSMSGMFYGSSVTSLDLSSFVTSKVTNMYQMFSQSKATSLNLSSFNTSNVTNMSGMFWNSAAIEIKGLEKFSTSKVTDMSHMFYYSAATTLDLSGFDTSNVTNMSNMFGGSKAATGYARTQTDADKFNASSGKPSGLTFVVKS